MIREFCKRAFFTCVILGFCVATYIWLTEEVQPAGLYVVGK